MSVYEGVRATFDKNIVGEAGFFAGAVITIMNLFLVVFNTTLTWEVGAHFVAASAALAFIALVLSCAVESCDRASGGSGEGGLSTAEEGYANSKRSFSGIDDNTH